MMSPYDLSAYSLIPGFNLILVCGFHIPLLTKQTHRGANLPHKQNVPASDRVSKRTAMNYGTPDGSVLHIM